jgi:hypothetical protein
MVGFKTLFLIIQLLLLSACIPQMKQSACEANEAFNATLRSCVPVVPGPEAFLNFNSVPSAPVTVHKNNVAALNFSVSVYNPYGQTYSLNWKRSFGSYATAGITMTSSTMTSWSTTAYSLYTSVIGVTSALGTHIISVELKNSTGVVVDVFNFEVNISDDLQPVITSTTPPTNYLSLTPASPSIDSLLSITVNNNGATGLSTTPAWTEWETYKNGVLLSTLNETDALPITTVSGINSASYQFNPALGITGPGNYLVRALVKRNVTTPSAATIVVSQKDWNVTVGNLPLQNVISQNVYKAGGAPPYDTFINAFHNLPYTSSTTYNFIPEISPAGQTDFCVQVADGRGSDTITPSYVRVDFYIDNIYLIHSGFTTGPSTTTSRVCLSDAPVSTLNTVLFNNPSLTTDLNRLMTARVFDLETGVEYGDDNVAINSLDDYPLKWNIRVKPLNKPPVISFATTGLANISGCTYSGNLANGCIVTQDQAFTIGINAINEDYLTTNTGDNNKFTYTMTLLRDGTPVSGQACTKTTTGTTGTPGDANGSDYHCTLTVPSSDALGPITPNIAGNNFSVMINFCDVGSLVTPSSPACGTTHYYNLFVNESNTAPTIAAQGAIGASNSYVTSASAPSTALTATTGDVFEGETLGFYVKVTDIEKDDFQVQLYLCDVGTSSGSTCNTSVVGTGSVDVENVTTYSSGHAYVSFTIPENFLPLGSSTSSPTTAYFKIKVVDIPDTAVTPGTFETGTTVSHFGVRIKNKNPPPQFAGTSATPISSSSTGPATFTALVGYPLTIKAGDVTDASIIATEKDLKYRWYVEINGSGTFTEIGDTSVPQVTWTPSNGIASGTVARIRVCVSDASGGVNDFPAAGSVGSTSIAIPNTANGPHCYGTWNVTVRPNAVLAQYGGSTTEVGTDFATWYDSFDSYATAKVFYSAYSDTNGKILIEKTVVNTDPSSPNFGVIYNNDTTGFRAISFDAIKGATQSPGSVKDISITGSSEYLLVAYQAADISTPSSPRIRVRRIDKRYNSIYGALGVSYPHPGKFGFMYDGSNSNDLWPTTNNSSAISIWQSALGEKITVSFNNPLSVGNFVDILNTQLVSTAAAVPTGTDLCAVTTTGCTTDFNAGKLTSNINTSTDRDLQGITAYTVGSTTEIYGLLSGADYLDNHPQVLSYIPGKLGKIVYDSNNNYWYLPFIDSSTAGEQGSVKVIQAFTSFVLNASLAVTVHNYDLPNVYTTFVNEIRPISASSDVMIIAAVNTNAKAELYNCPLSGATACTLSNTSLFGGSSIDPSSLRLAVPSIDPTTNNHYYVAAKVESTPSVYRWGVARYNATTLAETYSNFIYEVADVGSATVLGTSSGPEPIKNLSIQSFPTASPVSGYEEARMMVVSTVGANNNLYAVRVKADESISCGSCLQINHGSEVNSATKNLATTPIVSNSTIAFSSAAGMTGENIKDFLFAIYPSKTSSTNDRPYVGIFNMESEAITSSSPSTTGTLGHRPAFIAP